MQSDLLFIVYSFLNTIASALGVSVIIGKLSHGVLFLINRLTGGFGTIFFHHKGKKTGRRRYYIVAIMIYLLSWLLILIGSASLWRWFDKILRK
jgi:hypothetical protein